MTRLQLMAIGVFRRLARAGTLRLTLPTGQTVVLGSGHPKADLALKDYSVVRDVMQRGLIGFAEAYMSERIDTEDLRQLLAWGVANQRAWFESPIARWTLPIRRIWQRIVPGRRHPRVRSMNDHYNLGNSFYEAWLDETMTYSSARFEQPSDELAAAQRNKYEAIAAGSGLERGMRVLEIGCGWGGFAEYAAGEIGCDVVAVTLSTEQAEYASRRITDAGLSDKVDIRVQDFREVDGEYDAIVSIEMIESVDETHWSPLFETIASRLKPDSRASMQIITIVDSEWESYRSRADFIQQYIFPGGQLPAPKVLDGLAREVDLDIEKIETFGLDYARTLEAWRDRFTAAWPEIRVAHGLDERFRRMWDLYLTLCEAGFRMGRINVEQWVFSKPQTATS